MSVNQEPLLGNKSPGAFSSEHSRPPSSMSLSTNNEGVLPLNELRRLSIGTPATTPLPASSPIDLHAEESQQLGPFSPSRSSQPLSTPLRRTPSSSSLGRNDSTTPKLHKRLSISSLKGAGSVTPPRSPAFRRISSNQSLPHSSDMRPRSGLSAPPEEPIDRPMTSASVAQSYFQSELEAHHGANGSATDQEIVVILQDSCYGHRFSRPRTSKAGLNTIVERPERIHACILGLATAYVRLGGRHAEGSIPPHPNPDMNKVSSVPFRIHKTTRTLSLNSQAATAIHGAKWMDELRIMCDSAETKLALNGKELVRPPTEKTAGGTGNSGASQRKLHEGDLYLCSGSLSALEGALGAVCEGVDAVFAENGTKRAFVCIRPPGHHCSADYPSGFCWLNNVHVGIGHASLTHELTHAAIIDFDLHHGDGSQAITWEHNSRVSSLPKNARSKKTAIGYFSLHDINSYPCEMGDEDKVRNASLCLENAHGQSIWNVHLQPWKSETEFWNLYKERYITILMKARAFLKSTTQRLRSSPNLPKPRAAIFLSAGFDASEWESPGMQRHQVNVPTDFYARFTRDVIALADEEGLGVDGRVISVLEGGYSDRALMSGVLSHLSGLVTAPLPNQQQMRNGLGHEMSSRLGKLDIRGGESPDVVSPPIFSTETYDPRWWALEKLEEIENKIKPPAPLPMPKKPRNATPPTYTSTTQSYTAKIVSSPKSRRSLSSSVTNHSSLPPSSRPPTPPPPPVDWATAAHELSKLLIPSDRQTRSCQPEELNADASRARKDVPLGIGLPTDMPPPEGRMQLRDRRTKPVKYISDDEERPLSRSGRRKTVANVIALNQELESLPPLPSQTALGNGSRQTRRRLSVASNISSLNGERVPGLGTNAGVKDTARPDQITVRKTRAPSSPPAEVLKTRVTRKQPSAPRLPSGSAITSVPGNSSKLESSSLVGERGALAAKEDTKNCDVDSLASGMKKMSIKLNLPSKEEQEAREAKLRPASRGRPKSAAPKTRNPREPTKVKQVDKPTEHTTDIVAFKASEALPSQEAQMVAANSEPTELAAPSQYTVSPDPTPIKAIKSVDPEAPAPHDESTSMGSSPATAQPQTPSIPTSNPTSSNIPSPPIPTSNSLTSTLPVLPTYESLTLPQSPPKHQKHDLPVFTSTSPLHFASIPQTNIDQAIADVSSNKRPVP